MFSYGQIEKALAELHEVNSEAALKTFRSRIKHFQRIGVVPSAPGKGQRLSYTIADAVYWALCFDLAEMGIPPGIVKTIMELSGYNLLTFFTGYAMQQDQFYFMMAGEFISWQFADDGRISSGKYGVAIGKKAELDRSLENCPRLLVMNLTRLKEGLGRALKHAWANNASAWEPENVSLAKPRGGDRFGPDPRFQ